MSKKQKFLTHKQRIQAINNFIQNFEDFNIKNQDQYSNKWGKKKYMIILQKIKDQMSRPQITILNADFQDYFYTNNSMINILRNNVESLKKQVLEVITNILERLPILIQLPLQKQFQRKFDKILEIQRKENIFYNIQNQNDKQRLPINLHRNYDAGFKLNSLKQQKLSIHEINASHIGSLVLIKGIIIKSSDIKPKILVATYTCDTCGCQNYVQVNNDQHVPLNDCQSSKCLTNKIKGKLTFLPGHSNFISYQKLKLQQSGGQIPFGNIPKTLTVVVEGINIDSAVPGDQVTIHGVILIESKSSIKSQKNLEFKGYLKAYCIEKEKKKYHQTSITQQERQKIMKIKNSYSSKQFFSKLASSIAPEIYGLQDAKKAILLQLTGGRSLTTKQDKARIRGQINIAIIGDPGIAKSQLLKQVAKIAPRGVYTTGKGSSGVGLTAAIVTDPTTKQLTLQAGALVLADNGICCIDQFDKMDQRDRTSIHQVMQQQIVSIAKAGITTTLNARCGILAAGNPVYARYNISKGKHQNFNMPTSLLTRFDMIFVLLDKVDKQQDLKLAMHIARVHQNNGLVVKQKDQFFSQQFLRKYISIARSYQPIFSKKVMEKVAQNYVQKRSNFFEYGNNDQRSFVSSRYILAITRLCVARARLRFSNQVTMDDYLDASQLVESCDKSIKESKSPLRQFSKEARQLDNIYHAILKLIKEKSNVKESDILQYMSLNGYDKQKTQDTLQFYVRTEIFDHDQKGNLIIAQGNKSQQYKR